MRKRIKRLAGIALLITGLLCMILFVPWIIVRAWLTPLPDTIQEQLNDAAGYGMDGIIVYVDQGGKTPELYAAGWKDRDKKIRADPTALFKIASISKLYMAAAAVKLIVLDSLSVDDTLAALLPEYADRIENAELITMRMLLQHRSGIPDWIEDPEFPWHRSLTDVSKVLELVLDDPAEFRPDARYDYSNTNYLLIGSILDRVLGYSHRSYITQQICEPLGLTHTFGLLSDVDSNAVTSGYDAHYDGDVKMLDFVSPGGSMVATAEDVGIFVRALNDGSLLTAEEQSVYGSLYEYGHTGLLPGYQSIVHYHSDIDAVVVQFVNTSGGLMWSLAEVIYNRNIRILRAAAESS